MYIIKLNGDYGWYAYLQGFNQYGTIITCQCYNEATQYTSKELYVVQNNLKHYIMGNPSLIYKYEDIEVLPTKFIIVCENSGGFFQKFDDRGVPQFSFNVKNAFKFENLVDVNIAKNNLYKLLSDDSTPKLKILYVI